MSSFEAQFGAVKISVADYSAVAGERLQMPYPEVLPYAFRHVGVVAERMRKLARVVGDGKSVAVATGFKGAEYEERDPRKLAAESSTPQEIAQYDAWSAGGLCLPEFNWSENVDDSSMSKSIVKSMQDHADAMNILWKTDRAKPHHALWLSGNWMGMLPLVSAVILVEKAKKDLKGGSEIFTANEVAEIQTIDKACDQVTQFQNAQRGAAFPEVTNRDFEYSKQILLARKLAIEKNPQGRMPEKCWYVEFTSWKFVSDSEPSKWYADSVIPTEASIPAGIESRHNRKEVS